MNKLRSLIVAILLLGMLPLTLADEKGIDYAITNIFGNEIEAEEGVYIIYARETHKTFLISIHNERMKTLHVNILNIHNQGIYTTSCLIEKDHETIDLAIMLKTQPDDTYNVVLVIENTSNIGAKKTEKFTVIFKESKNITYKLKDATQREPSTIVGKRLKLYVEFPEEVNRLYAMVQYQDEGETKRYFYLIEGNKRTLQLPEIDNPEIYSYEIQLHSYDGKYIEEFRIHCTTEEFYKENWCYYNYKTCNGIFYSIVGLIFIIGISFGRRYYIGKHKEVINREE